VSAIAWGLVYGHGFIGILKMMMFMVFVDFVVVGMVISTICWYATFLFFKKKNKTFDLN